MPEYIMILALAGILIIIGVWVLRFFDRVRGSTGERKEIIERLDRIERRLTEREEINH